MWNRADLKSKGKAAFQGNYWPCVIVALILNLLTAGTAGSVSRKSQEASDEIAGAVNGMDESVLIAVLVAIVSVVAVIGIVSLLLRIFVFNPLEVGCYHFFKKNVQESKASIGVIKEGFGNYVHVFLTLLVRDIFLVLWSCLFCIPGIIKGYSYRMVPFIIKDNPELSATEVITKSREMMNGNKWAAFVLDLSFIGWHLLGICTLGLVSLLWTNPYVYNTNAALYLELKNRG